MEDYGINLDSPQEGVELIEKSGNEGERKITTQDIFSRINAAEKGDVLVVDDGDNEPFMDDKTHQKEYFKKPYIPPPNKTKSFTFKTTFSTCLRDSLVFFLFVIQPIVFGVWGIIISINSKDLDLSGDNGCDVSLLRVVVIIITVLFFCQSVLFLTRFLLRPILIFCFPPLTEEEIAFKKKIREGTYYIDPDGSKVPVIKDDNRCSSNFALRNTYYCIFVSIQVFFYTYLLLGLILYLICEDLALEEQQQELTEDDLWMFSNFGYFIISSFTIGVAAILFWGAYLSVFVIYKKFIKKVKVAEPNFVFN